MAVGLTIAGQSLDIEGAWKHNRSLRRLRSAFASRGESEPMPYVSGRTAFPTRPDEVVVDLELMVFGRNSGAGAPFANILAGLDTNLEYLSDWVRGLADGVETTYEASLETNSGTVHTAEVQVINWQILADNVTQVVIGYDVRIPSGQWA